jgi:peptide subunit release factor 1 (eRF1)
MNLKPSLRRGINMEKENLSKNNLDNLVSTLKVSSDDYISLHIKPSSFPHYINGLSLQLQYNAYACEIKELVKIKSVAQAVERYNTGAAIYWQKNSNNQYIVLPPFPITEDKISLGKFDASPLLEALERVYIIGVVLVTWGTYSIGIFHRDNLVKSKTGTGYIHKEHRKGGRSEKRFARRTEEQKKDFLRKVSNRTGEEFENYALDYIFFGGNRLIRAPLLRECKYLQREAQKISQRVLNLRYADKEALNYSLKEITKSLVFTF